jgi:hypothetical protein
VKKEKGKREIVASAETKMESWSERQSESGGGRGRDQPPRRMEIEITF